MGEAPDNDPVVREKTLGMQLKLLEQRLTIKFIAGLVAASALPHLSIPSSVTAGAIGGIVLKVVLGAVR